MPDIRCALSFIRRRIRPPGFILPTLLIPVSLAEVIMPGITSGHEYRNGAMQMLVILLTVSSVALAGIGGLYYSFACAVMPGLRMVDDATFVRTMKQINASIQNPWFALSFAGAFLALAATGIYAWTNGLDAALPATIAWVLYSATLAITMAFNIPLNNRLDRDAAPGNESRARSAFETSWTRWNIHRSWIALTAIVSLCLAWR